MIGEDAVLIIVQKVLGHSLLDSLIMCNTKNLVDDEK